MALPRARVASTTDPPSIEGRGHATISAALYNWCRDNHDSEDVLLQEDLLKSEIIPNRDLKILQVVCQSLINDHLFKTHDVRGGGIGWKLVSAERAEKYKDLNADESLVYSIIDSAGSTGIWTKTIKQRLNIHAKITERAFKTLESKGFIKPMKNVKFPNRKMYIIASLQPSEDATGGAWFTDGILDVQLLSGIGDVVEVEVSKRSWLEVVVDKSPADGYDESPAGPGQKRKEPHGGFDEKGKGKEKAARTDGHNARKNGDGTEETHPQAEISAKDKPASTSKRVYEPHPAQYRGYPSLQEITNHVNASKISHNLLPQNAIAQLLDVMVYDDRLIKISTLSTIDNQLKTVYKARKNIAQVKEAKALEKKRGFSDDSTRKAAIRQLELQDIGSGGMTEIPCARCPVFHLCEIGGPVSVENCEYFDQWFQKLEELRFEHGEVF